LWLEDNKKEKELEKKEIEAIQKGINFLLATDKKFVGAATITIKDFNEICKNEKIDKLWRENVEEDIGQFNFMDPLYSSVYPDLTVSELNDIPEETNRIIAKAVYCKKVPQESILKEINELERDGGYNSTHILKAISIATREDCYEDNFFPLIIDLVDELSKKEDEEGKRDDLCGDNIGLDLYNERAAFISEMGFPLKDSWIENIIRCQQADGKYGGYSDGGDSDSELLSTHTTALGLYALIADLGYCK